MRPPPRSATTAVILAGGRGQRLGGRDKARLCLQRRTVLERLAGQLRQVAGEIIVVRARPRDNLRLPAGCIRAWDQNGSQGPLSGLAAGLARASGHWCLCVPVDCASLPDNLPAQLARGSHQGGYAQHRDDHYYLHALLPRQSRHRLATFRRTGGRSAANACRTLQLAPVSIVGAHTAWSINTPEERRRLHWQRKVIKRC